MNLTMLKINVAVFAILITPALDLSQAHNRTDGDILQNSGSCSVNTMYETGNIFTSTIICDGEVLEAIFPNPESLDSEAIVSRSASAGAAAELLDEHGFILASCRESHFGLAFNCVYIKPKNLLSELSELEKNLKIDDQR